MNCAPLLIATFDVSIDHPTVAYPTDPNDLAIITVCIGIWVKIVVIISVRVAEPEAVAAEMPTKGTIVTTKRPSVGNDTSRHTAAAEVSTSATEVDTTTKSAGSSTKVGPTAAKSTAAEVRAATATKSTTTVATATTATTAACCRRRYRNERDGCGRNAPQEHFTHIGLLRFFVAHPHRNVIEVLLDATD